MPEARRPELQTLHVVHLGAGHIAVGIEDQNLGIGFFRLVELSRPGVIVALEKQLLHGRDPILELVGHRRIVRRPLGIVDLGLVGQLLFLQVFQVRGVGGISGFQADGDLQIGGSLGELDILRQIVRLSGLRRGESGLGPTIKMNGRSSVIQSIERVLKTIRRLVVFFVGEQAVPITNRLRRADRELMPLRRLILHHARLRHRRRVRRLCLGRGRRRDVLGNVRSVNPKCREWQQCD
jgi:hypothetical protein